MSSKIRNINRRLTILQYNVHTSKNLVMTSCLRNLVIKKFDILAIKKSWRNIYTKIIYHSLKDTFQLIYLDSKKINENVVRICFFVNKRISIVDLSYSFRSEDLITLQIKLIENVNVNDEHYIQIHNLYNESNIKSCTFLTELQMFLREKNRFNNEDSNSFTQHIIVEDFNIHHSIWKDVQVKADLRASELLTIMNEFQLISNLKFEISIFVSCRKNEIIINLCLTTKELTNRIIICRIRENLNHDFDHLFIKTILNVSINTILSEKKFCWNRLNKIKFENILNQKLFNTSNETNMRFLDDYTINVCKVIIQIIEIFILKTTISVKITSKFDDRCKDVRIRINQTKRALQQSLIEKAKKKIIEKVQNAWKRVKNNKKRTIKRILKRNHRKTVEKATKNAQKTWKLTKWAKNKKILFKFNTSSLRRSNDTIVLTKTNKTHCLKEFFFSSLTKVNIDDIVKATYFEEFEFSHITDEKIHQTVFNASSNKTSKKDEIFNRILKTVFSHIASALNWIFNTNLTLKYCFKHFKKSIIISLRKSNKFDYFIFKAYRSIILLNTMNKIMKIIMTSRFSYATEKYELLSRNQFENKQKIFIEHVLHFITKKIHTIWVNDEITIMLFLNVTNVYDNICHFRLFHNLKKRRIKDNSLKWIISFLSKKYIILKFVNYITDRIKIKIEFSQNSFISLILYLFYNAKLLETCTDESLKTATSDFVNDVAIMTIDNTKTDILKALRKSHEKTIKWAKTHESVFAPAKYQLIHFRKNISISFEFFLKLSNHFVNFEKKCKYLKIIMNSRLQWQNHLQYLKKQSTSKLTIFSAFAEFIWNIETENLRRTYLVIVLFQFIYCASIWYVFTKKHDFKQREKKTIKFLTDIQTRTAQIIAEAFKFTSSTTLEIEFHLLSIRQQFDVFIYDALLRIIISLIYEHIRSQRKLSDRAWMLEATQHQRTLYVQLSSLHKLEIKYATIFKKNIINFENRISFSAFLWWQSSKIIIILIVEAVVETHNQIMKNNYSTIFTNDSDIENKIKIFAMTIFISIKKETSIMMKKNRHMLNFSQKKQYISKSS